MEPENSIAEEKINMSTLVSRMNNLKEEGYSDEYTVIDGKLTIKEGEKRYSPAEVKIVNFYRFEGDSDPADNSILYAIETNDGAKGILINAYGPYADEQEAKFITEVEEINKKTEKVADV